MKNRPSIEQSGGIAKMNPLNPLFCKACRRKLGEAAGIYRIRIVCRRCRQLNHFQAA